MQGKFTEDRIKELATKWLNNTITPDEQKEFSEWYNYGQEAPVNIPSAFAENEEVLKNRILSKINETISHDDKKIKHINPKLWISIAASLLLFAGFTFYYHLHNKQLCADKLAYQKAHPANDVKPGGAKAILTLSSGIKINLNDTKKGLLASQGKTLLKKNKDGQITYEAGGNNQNPALIYNTITVPVGGQFQVVLSDSTKVWLNSSSSITFPVAFSKSERKISINGEAYLEVAKNKHLPFRVVTNKQTIEVLGTHFNINAYSDEPSIKTTLAEGSVKVTANGQTVVLKPQEQSDVLNDNFQKIDVNTADIDNVLAWKNGIFQFNNAEMPFIMREIARWYDVQVKYEGDVVQRKFTGSISRNVNLSELLNMLKYTGVDFKMQGHIITVINN
jgi:transmembrane sensor